MDIESCHACIILRDIYNDLILTNFNKNAIGAMRAKGFNYKQKREKRREVECIFESFGQISFGQI